MTFYENKFAAKLFNYNIFRFSTALESKIKEFGKYTAASFLSTGADYSAFYVLLLTSIPTVSATILSHIIGSIVAFVLLFKWVFPFAEKHDVEPLILKFAGAQSFSLISNATGFWLLIRFTNTSTWTARISTAILVWTFMYFINKFFVFKK